MIYMNSTLDKSYFDGKSVLITGGAGFIGSSLAQALVPMGAKVTILDALLPQYGGNKFNFKGIEDDVQFIEGDIRDSELVRETVKGKDIVYHLAAQVSYLDSKAEPLLDVEINAKGHLNVLEAVKDFSPEARVLFASSRLVYGKIQEVPVKESHPTEPLSLYGIHKLLGEKYFSYYAREFGLNAISVRIPNPYGPRQQMKHAKYSIVGWFVRQAMEGNEIQIFGDGEQERDYLYIDDIVEAFLQLTQKGEPGEVYNIGTHERVKFGEMVDAVLEAAGSGSKKYVPWPEDYEKNETGDYIADTTKIEAATGWNPEILLKDGISRMVEYYRANKEHYWE